MPENMKQLTSDLTPDQRQPRLPRARGCLRLGFTAGGGRTRLAELFMSGSSKAILPTAHGTEPHLVMLNTAGGLTGGDAFEVDLRLDDGAHVTAATQTAERAYRSTGAAARIEVSLRLGAGACLHWLAQETILFEGAHLRRRLTVDMAPDATALIVEPVILGRAAMGETPQALHFRDSWRVHRDGHLAHAEETRIIPPLSDLRRGAAGLGDDRAFATMIYLGADAGDRLDPLRAALGPLPLRVAASAWQGKLAVRMAAPGGQALRAALLALIPLFRGTPMPRVWTM